MGSCLCPHGADIIVDDNKGLHWSPPSAKWQSLWLKSAQGLRRVKVGQGELQNWRSSRFRNLTLIPQDLIHKTCNYRVPVFNCNFGNDLQLHTNYRVITSNVLTAAINAIWSSMELPSQCLWGSDKGRVLGTSSIWLVMPHRVD